MNPDAQQSNTPVQPDEQTSQAPQPPIKPLDTGNVHPDTLPVEKKSKKKPIILAVAAVLAVVLTGGVVFGLWYNKPENVVADSFMKILTAESSEGTLTAKISDEGTPTVSIAGGYKQSLEQEMLGKAKIEIDDNGKKYSLDSAFAVSKDQTMYVKVDKLRETIDGLTEAQPMIGFYTEVFNDVITSVDGKWISISQSDLKELTGEDQADKELVCVEQKYNEFLKDTKQQNELKALYEKHTFIKVESKGTETVDGVFSNRYLLSSDVKAANEFANGAKSLTVFKNIDGCLEQDLAKDVNDEIKDAVELDEGEKTTAEYWVGVWSHEPVKFKVNSTGKSGTLDLEFNPKLNTKPAVSMPKADKTFVELSKDIEAATSSFYDTFDPSTLDVDTTSSF